MAAVTGAAEPRHGFAGRFIRCECGVFVRAERFEAHLRKAVADKALRGIQVAIHEVPS